MSESLHEAVLGMLEGQRAVAGALAERDQAPFDSMPPKDALKHSLRRLESELKLCIEIVDSL